MKEPPAIYIQELHVGSRDEFPYAKTRVTLDYFLLLRNLWIRPMSDNAVIFITSNSVQGMSPSERAQFGNMAVFFRCEVVDLNPPSPPPSHAPRTPAPSLADPPA